MNRAGLARRPFGSIRLPRADSYRPRLESLETRTLLSASFSSALGNSAFYIKNPGPSGQLIFYNQSSSSPYTTVPLPQNETGVVDVSAGVDQSGNAVGFFITSGDGRVWQWNSHSGSTTYIDITASGVSGSMVQPNTVFILYPTQVVNRYANGVWTMRIVSEGGGANDMSAAIDSSGNASVFIHYTTNIAYYWLQGTGGLPVDLSGTVTHISGSQVQDSFGDSQTGDTVFLAHASGIVSEWYYDGGSPQIQTVSSLPASADVAASFYHTGKPFYLTLPAVFTIVSPSPGSVDEAKAKGGWSVSGVDGNAIFGMSGSQNQANTVFVLRNDEGSATFGTLWEDIGVTTKIQIDTNVQV